MSITRVRMARMARTSVKMVSMSNKDGYIRKMVTVYSIILHRKT